MENVCSIPPISHISRQRQSALQVNVLWKYIYVDRRDNYWHQRNINKSLGLNFELIVS